MPPAKDLLNKGFIVNHPCGARPDKDGRTVIVTGLHRSGTSLVASILQHAGLFMGTAINDIVYEDEEIAGILASGDIAALTRIIGERNADYRTWGFKLPMLWTRLRRDQLPLFNNPYLIVMFRDPIAMSVRTSLSEYREPMRVLRDAIDDLNALMAFVDGLDCPSLLLSYEKALTLPADFVDAIMQFCEMPLNAQLRAHLAGVIEPNRPTYIDGARRRYEGLIEGLIDGRLNGWCRLSQSSEPVRLELLTDNVPTASFVADVFRQDLLDAGFGEGNHGFSLDVGRLGVRHDAIVCIRIAGHAIELTHSGYPLEHYRNIATR